MMDLESGGTTQPSSCSRYTWVYSELSSVAQFMFEHAVALIAGGRETPQSHDGGGAGDGIELSTARGLSFEAPDCPQAILSAIEPPEPVLEIAPGTTAGEGDQSEPSHDTISEQDNDRSRTKQEDLEKELSVKYQGTNGRALLIAFKTGQQNDGIGILVPVSRPSSEWARAVAEDEFPKEDFVNENGEFEEGKWRKKYDRRREFVELQCYPRSEEDIWEAIVAAWRAHLPFWHRAFPFWRLKTIEETHVRPCLHHYRHRTR